MADNPYARLVTKEQFIRAAAEHGITLLPTDFAGREPGDLYLDGTAAEQWLEAMTME